jgi:glycosyltransferase involved in cell wall biosynthesis
MNRKSLHQLYAEHTGKVSDKWSLYLTECDRLFDDYRDKPVRLLEIGIQNGGSLEIWSKYFGNASALIGCDINPDCARLSYDDPRICVIVGDANAPDVREQVLLRSPQFDIIIDDGSHLSSDIIKSFALYFPRVVEGGVFIAEDLHCSYWGQFEGGLFDPYSSISFFKRLADVINHQHWGIPKARADILRGIFTKYGCEVDAEALSQVHSVEFINSMCVVRKAPAVDNGLGRRVIAGSMELVIPGLKDRIHEPDPILDQSRNPWTARTTPPDEAIESTELALANAQQQHSVLEQQIASLNQAVAERDGQIASLNQAVAERDGQIAALYSSTSWRLTRPLRIVTHQMKRVRRVAELAMPAIKRGGGLKNTFKKAVQLYRREGLAGIRFGFRIVATTEQTIPMPGSGEYGRNDYAEWIRRYDTLTDESCATMRARIDGFSHKPLISVVMPTYNPKSQWQSVKQSQWLIEAIESVRKQIYPYWELCIADDASPDKAIRPILERYTKDDSRIKVVFREQNGNISAASNSALELATGEWVALLDHDDLLSEHALFWVADAINQNPDVRLIYSDEDKIDEVGRRFYPYFKCDWNVDLFYSYNMLSHLGVYHAALLNDIGRFRVGLEGAQDYDLALRCVERIEPKQIRHIPRVLYHWRMHAESTAQSADSKPYAMLAGERALNEHFQRQKINGRVELVGHGYRVRYALPDIPPMVSLIIPTRNGLQLIRQCVESILKKTTYPNYEILIVDNGSDDPATLRYLDELRGKTRVRVVRDDRPFNYSALNNAAVKLAQGEVLGLLNNDLEVISPEWLSEMVSIALQPGVGAVGARLWYPNDTLQHGGVLLGVGGVANHAHLKILRGMHGYFSRASLIQSFSAVTAACLVIRKAIYEQVGGLNETDLQVAFNDVDFCLRAREAGYRNVWTPYAELYHHESATRGYEDTPEKQARFAKEVQYMKQSWGDTLLNDPAYSPNLTLDHEAFSLAWPPRVEIF